MSAITVTVRTAELVNPEAGNDKFYRTYAGDGWSVYQWGSQRNGRSGGQSKVILGDTAVTQFGKKTREGYTPVAHYAFRIDDEAIKTLLGQGTKEAHNTLAGMLDNARASNPDGKKDTVLNSRGVPMGSSAPSVPMPAPVGAPFAGPSSGTDPIEMLTDRVQDAIQLAVDDPNAAMIVMVELREAIEDAAERTLKMRSFFDTLELIVTSAVTGR